MDEKVKEFLFAKHILVNDYDGAEDNAFETLFALARLFSVKIVKGHNLLNSNLIPFVAHQIGFYVPEAFYKGFPQTVRQLTRDKLAFDQLVHYTVTYGFGDFSQAGHSLFEQDFERVAFKEKTTLKQFEIVTESQAEQIVVDCAKQMLETSRPLSFDQYVVLRYATEKCGLQVTKCACKDTVVRLLCDTRNLQYLSLLSLPDVIKVAENVNYYDYANVNVKKLRFSAKDRKFVTQVIDCLLQPNANVRDCFEKKKIWCGLLHHVHYVAKTDFAKDFVNAIRNKGNLSIYALFDLYLKQNDVEKACNLLKQSKGNGALLRNLTYLLSRCKTQEQAQAVLNAVDASNATVLLQLIVNYSQTDVTSRDFTFAKFGRLLVHSETEQEVAKRKSAISEQMQQVVLQHLRSLLKLRLANKLQNVYVDDDMALVALPLQQTTSHVGLGVLAKGSRLRLDVQRKKVRAFTYWEKVRDIDLSVIGLNRDGTQQEYSWRTMAGEQSEAIAFSGDQTSGFEGGSEFFDVDVQKFSYAHPNTRYLVFCNNVYSGTPFSDCYCKAGYMLRDIDDSGQVFEPKTVQSSFWVEGDTTFNCLFAIDLDERDFVWLNVDLDSSSKVAGANMLTFLKKYLNVTDVINVKDLFTMLATNLVADSALADVVVSDKPVATKPNAQVVHSYDWEVITKYLN